MAKIEGQNQGRKQRTGGQTGGTAATAEASAAENPKTDKSAETTPGETSGEKERSAKQTVKPIWKQLQERTTHSVLTAEAKEYRDTLVDWIDGNEKSDLKARAVQVHPLEGLTVYNPASPKKEAIILIFEEAFSSQQDIVPPTAYQQQLVNEEKNNDTEPVNPITCVVVSRDDYSKISQMYSYLTNALELRQELDVIQNQAFSGAELEIDTDINNVRQFIQQHSPHSVLPRTDFGALVSVPEPSEQPQNVPQQEPRRLGLLAIAGYTEFIQVPAAQVDPQAAAQGQPVKYLPLTRITEICTPIPVCNMLGLALPLAAEVFIRQRRWLTAFGYSENERNLGNLIEDRESGKMWQCQNQYERDELLGTYMVTPPFLGVDIMDGRARIPGIETIWQTQGNSLGDKVSTNLKKFFGINEDVWIDSFDGGLSTTGWNEFGGTVDVQGQKLDLREIDYMNLAKEMKDPTTLAPFLQKHADPSIRVREIQKIFPDVDVQYTGVNAVIHGHAIRDMTGYMNQSGHIRVKYLQPVPEMAQDIAMLAQNIGIYNDMGQQSLPRAGAQQGPVFGPSFYY